MAKILKLSTCLTVLALAACASTPPGPTQLPSPPSWPNPNTVSALLGGIEGAYSIDCIAQPQVSWCSKSAQREAASCKAAADAGLVTYTDAYNSGNVTQAILANEATLLPALIACIGKVKHSA